MPGATANNTDAAVSASCPATSGSLRPMRSEYTPIGTDTANSVTPKEANSSPISVGDAPNCRLKCGRTGTATEYAKMSVNTANVTSPTAADREVQPDIQK